MTYNIREHIDAAHAKDEDWCVEQLERILMEVEADHPFTNGMQTLHILAHMSFIQRQVRDGFPSESVDFGTEWSKLIIIENVQQMVQKAIHETGGEDGRSS